MPSFAFIPAEFHSFLTSSLLGSFRPHAAMDTLAFWLWTFGKFDKHAFSSLLPSPRTQNCGRPTVGSFPLSNPAWAVGLEGWETQQFTMSTLKTNREQNGRGGEMESKQRDYMEEPQKNILPQIWLQSRRNKTSEASSPGCLLPPQTQALWATHSASLT